MTHLIYLLRRFRLSVLKAPPVFELSPNERRELIFDIQDHTFRHLEPEHVRLVTSWALSIAEVGDDALVGMWEQKLAGH